jgi:hypothetical protein
LFGYALGPHSWKRYLFPPHTMLWQASRSEDGLTIEAGHEDPPGTRSSACRGCELAAMRPGQGLPRERRRGPRLSGRRGPAFIVAVNTYAFPRLYHPAGVTERTSVYFHVSTVIALVALRGVRSQAASQSFGRPGHLATHCC